MAGGSRRSRGRRRGGWWPGGGRARGGWASMRRGSWAGGGGAEKVDKLQAICVRCGELATRNQRLIDGQPAPAEGPTIQVGGLESYEARCRRCHRVPLTTRHQTELEIGE